jgi:F0F1-type ATP synthase membrane subunit b/b'
MDLVFVDPSTFVVQFVLILIILWVLNKFLFKPYLAYLDEWEDKHRKLEEDYNNIDSLIKDANKQKEEILLTAKNR